mmetsp:Transcript_87349/g.138645  ORF Transcript_87349/g.138645 Transcript_87349/m.138645 type:complete len:257 (-) Transcript_87349:510-1280(-)
MSADSIQKQRSEGDSLSLASIHLLVVLRRLHLRRLHPARALIGPDRARSSRPGPLWTLHAFREAKSIPVATEGALLAHLHTCSFAVIPHSTRDTKSSIACPMNRLVGSNLTSCARRLVCGRHFLAVLPRTTFVASQQRGSSLSRAPCSRRTVCTSQWCCGTSCRTPFPRRARLTDLRCFCPALSTPSAFGTHFTRCRIRRANLLVEATYWAGHANCLAHSCNLRAPLASSTFHTNACLCGTRHITPCPTRAAVALP